MEENFEEEVGELSSASFKSLGSIRPWRASGVESRSFFFSPIGAGPISYKLSPLLLFFFFGGGDGFGNDKIVKQSITVINWLESLLRIAKG